jgi:nucleoside-diphosphate-sugar epimerase
MLDKILLDDFEEIFNNKKIKWKVLKNKTILITGANGFIASYIIYFLIFLNQKYNFKIKIILIGRNKKKLNKKFINKNTKKKFILIEQDVCRNISIKEKIDFIMHLASIASPKIFFKKPIETILPNVIGTNELLKLSIKKKVKSFLFFSSGEIYGNHNKILKENTINNLNHLTERASYSESKRMGEVLCYSYFKQKKIPVKIIRLFHTYGPCMNLNDGRVMMDFVNNIVNQKNILIKGTGNQKRSFCYISDAVIGIFLLLINGQNGEAYNLGNPKELLSIKKLANLLSKYNNKISVKINPKLNSHKKKAPYQTVVPEIKKISRLGFSPKINVKKGFKKTINYFKSIL